MLEAESDSVRTRAALARQRSSHASAEMAEGGEAEHQQRGNCGKNGGRFGNGTDATVATPRLTDWGTVLMVGTWRNGPGAASALTNAVVWEFASELTLFGAISRNSELLASAATASWAVGFAIAASSEMKVSAAPAGEAAARQNANMRAALSMR